jgi:hypothetical protein
MSVDEAGVPQKLIAQSNLILYSGADLMAQALGNSGKQLNYLYFEFTNQNTISPVTPARDQGIGYYNMLPGSSGGNVGPDYLRVPLVTNPVLSSTGANYAGNSVTFSAMTAGYATGVHGLAITDGTSKFYGVALASIGANDVPAQDVVFSRSYFDANAITKLAGQQLAAYWSIIFS